MAAYTAEQVITDDTLAATERANQELYSKYFPVFPLIKELQCKGNDWFTIACDTFGPQAVATYLSNEARLHATK